MSTMLYKIAGLTAAIGAGFTATDAVAYDPGDMILRIGYATVQPNDDSSTLSLSSDFNPALDAGSLPGTSASKVDNGDALGITFTYMLTEHIGVELLAATPFKHDIQADLSGLGLGVGELGAGLTKHLPPTLSVQWYPLNASAKFQPYIGVGLNYTTFFSEDVDTGLQGAVGVAADVLLGGDGSTPVPLNGELTLDDSWGLAAQVGFDYVITQQWHANLAIWYADIDTDATISFDLPDGTEAASVAVDVEIDPLVYMFSLAYRF